MSTTTARRIPSAAVAVAAVAVGAFAGAMVANGSVTWTGVALACAAVVAVVLTFRRLEFGLIAMLFVIPLDRFGRILTRPFTVTAFQVLLMACLAAWVMQLVRRRATWRLSPLDLAAAAMVLAGLWSLPTSLAPASTLMYTGRLVFTWGFAVLYANSIRDAASLRRLMAWLVGIATGLSVLGMAQYFLPGIGIGWVTQIKAAFNVVYFSRVGAFYYDPNTFAGLLAAIVTVCLTMLIHARRGREAALWGLAAAVNGFTLVLTFSRGGWVCAAAGVAVAIVLAPKGRRVWLVSAVAALAIVAVAVAPGAIASRVASIFSPDTDVSVGTRYYMYQSAAEIAATYPTFGTGLGAFDKAYPAFRKPGSDFGIVKPHQLVVALVSETGIAGLIAEIVFAGAVVAIYWRRRPHGWGPLEAAIMAGLVTLIVGSAFEYYLFFEYLWLFLGLSVAVARISDTSKEDAR